MNAEDYARTQRFNGARPARIIRSFRGEFSEWKVGDLIFAKVSGSGLLIDRRKWRKPWVALANQCFAVPPEFVIFEEDES